MLELIAMSYVVTAMMYVAQLLTQYQRDKKIKEFWAEVHTDT